MPVDSCPLCSVSRPALGCVDPQDCPCPVHQSSKALHPSPTARGRTKYNLALYGHVRVLGGGRRPRWASCHGTPPPPPGWPSGLRVGAAWAWPGLRSCPVGPSPQPAAVALIPLLSAWTPPFPHLPVLWPLSQRGSGGRCPAGSLAGARDVADGGGSADGRQKGLPWCWEPGGGGGALPPSVPLGCGLGAVPGVPPWPLALALCGKGRGRRELSPGFQWGGS